jgi:hypothetical protein
MYVGTWWGVHGHLRLLLLKQAVLLSMVQPATLPGSQVEYLKVGAQAV